MRDHINRLEEKLN